MYDLRLKIKDVDLDQRPHKLWTIEIIDEQKYRSCLFNSAIKKRRRKRRKALCKPACY